MGSVLLCFEQMIFRVVIRRRKEGRASGNSYNKPRHLPHSKASVIRNVGKKTSTT